jgi:DNA repair ATPase RecN
VRALAHRSADAAKEIKQLIGESAAKVEGGTALVTQAGQAMEEIISAVQNVTGLISKVADTTEEQSQGIDQVNQSIAQLDGVAQQNAALVEEASAAAESLRDEVHALTQLVDQFKIGAVTQAKSIDLPKPQKAAMSNRPLPPRSLSQKSPPIKQVRAPADSNEDWTEF